MKRTARFVALAGVSAGLVLSICGWHGSGATPQNETQQSEIKREVSVAMATAANAVPMPDASKDDAIVVAVTRDGKVFLGIDIGDARDLGARVRDTLANKVNKEVYLRADARANFRRVEDVIDSLRAADVEYVGLLVGRKNADAHQGFGFPKFPAGLELIVLSRPMMKEHFPKGITESMDRVYVRRGPTGSLAYKINQTEVQKAELLPKLTEMYKNRAERVLFIQADDDLDFASVVEAIDIAKGADVDHIAILTPKVLAGH